MAILQFCRRIDQPEPIVLPASLRLRTYTGPEDTRRWLDLRHRAFGRARLGVRQWNDADFAREFLDKPWWRPEHLWFIESDATPVGTVTLAFRGDGNAARPVVHWLAVLPSCRRRGIGRLLMNVLHARAWDLGYREVWLETHTEWQEAVALYRALGYGECR